jgi:hypothetical protein
LATREGLKIEYWEAQTRTGEKILGGPAVLDKDIPPIKTITCPICGGIGRKRLSENAFYSCVVCNGSGLTKQGHWSKWRDWQLLKIKTAFLQSQEGGGLTST